MNTSLFARNGIVRFIVPFLLSTLALVGQSIPASACTMQLTLHNDKSGQTNYITLTYKGVDGQTRDHVICQPVPPLQWADVSAEILVGQTMWLRYFHSSKCNPSSQFMSVNLPVPANPTFNHCWFNPDNVDTPNWSGCVNPSQTLAIQFS